jgi:hypothetical protein
MECRITETKPVMPPQESTETHEEVLKRIRTEAEQVGTKIVKVVFTEYTGRRKKKVTHIEVTQAELDELLSKSDQRVTAQLAMF